MRRIAAGVLELGTGVHIEVIPNRMAGGEAITRAIAKDPRVLHLHIRYPDNTLLELALATLARRRGNARRSVAAMRQVASTGAIVWFNAMFLHPNSTVADVRAELRFLKIVRRALFNTIKLRPFSGTSMETRLSAAGALSGGAFLKEYGFADPVLRRFDAHVSRFQHVVLGPYDPALRLHDMLLSATISTKHGQGNVRRAIIDHLWELGDQLNADRVATLEQLLHCAEQFEDPTPVFADAQQRFDERNTALDAVTMELELAGLARVSRHYAHVAAAATLVVALSTSGCQHVSSGDEDSDSATEVTARDSASSSAEDTGDTDSIGTDFEDSDDADSNDADSATETETDAIPTPLVCGPDIENASSLRTALEGWCTNHPGETGALVFAVDAAGKVTNVAFCFSWDHDVTTQSEVLACYNDLLKDEVFPCLENSSAYCPMVIE